VGVEEVANHRRPSPGDTEEALLLGSTADKHRAGRRSSSSE
jgi:hypothetical protein